MEDQSSDEKDEKRVHEKFNAGDSDVTIESFDGVLFHLHTQNLKITTGAFPGSEFSTEGETTKLTEDAEVLEVVFTYIYPQRYPTLEGMSFLLLAKVAEAVEKYEVFPAMYICAIRMNEFLPEHAADILAHGAKHGYPKLFNDAALALCRSPRMSEFIHKFPPSAFLAWIKYSESWKAIFQSALERIESMGKLHLNNCSVNYQNTNAICDTCRVALTKWVTELEKIVSLPDLKDSLGPFAHHKHPITDGLEYCLNCSPYKKCMVMEKERDTVVKTIERGITEIKPFENYF